MDLESGWRQRSFDRFVQLDSLIKSLTTGSMPPLTLIVAISNESFIWWPLELWFKFSNHRVVIASRLFNVSDSYRSSSKRKQLNDWNCSIMIISALREWMALHCVPQNSSFSFEKVSKALFKFSSRGVKAKPTALRVSGRKCAVNCIQLVSSNCNNYLNNCASMRMPCLNNS